MTLIVGVCLFAVMTFAQQPAPPPVCDNGLIELQGNVTGRLTICSALAIQAPQLVRQLEAIDEAFQGQQRQIAQLTRLARGVNSVGQNMGSRRQSELLRNLLTQLQTNQRVGPDQTERLMTVLADEFERLRDEMFAGLTNRGSAERVQAALEGMLGDSIAQLNLSEAEKQLSDIRAQLQTIGSQLTEANQRTANIQATLDERRMDMPRVASAVAAADVRTLRALSAAGLQTTVLEEALRVTDAKGQTTASRFFENSAESADAAQWFDDALAAGLDANLTVPSANFDREALLSVAMQAGNVPAMRALLRRGASPHPYQRIVATIPLKPRFLFPLDALASDSRLSQTDKQSLARLFVEAGAVIPMAPPAGGSYRGGEVAHELSTVAETVRTKTGTSMAPLAPGANLNQICRQAAPRTGEDWCAIVAAVPKKLTFKSSAQSWNWYDIELQYVIHITRTRLYFLATSGDYTLAEISKDGSTWTLYRYGGDSAGQGSCRSRESYRTDHCWKYFTLQAVPGTNQMKSDGREAIWTFDQVATSKERR